MEAVAAAAQVSTRTFFNYFPSKEDAVIGLREPVLEDSMLESFSLEIEPLREVAHLTLAVLRSIHGGDDAVSCHTELLDLHPHLRQRRFHYVLKVEQLVTAAVAERLHGSRRWQGAIVAYPADDVARMLVMVAGTASRYVMQKTAADPGRESQFAALDDGLALLRTVMAELP